MPHDQVLYDLDFITDVAQTSSDEQSEPSISCDDDDEKDTIADLENRITEVIADEDESQ